MLDNETKRRINSLRDILVGKLPDPKAQVEQITNGLIYKFMNDMDKESISMGGKATYFSEKFEKYSWRHLMDTKTSGVEKVSLYSEAIKEMYNNDNLPELFRDIFKGSFLPFQDAATLNMFLKEINEFNYSNSEKLGDAFEYLLSFMGSQGDAGQFRTPRHIIDFIVEIVNPKKNERILDPACGTAGFLISSYKHILKQNTKKNSGDLLNASDRKKIGENLNGYDISPDMVKMSLVNMYLHKFTNPKIDEYDTLSSQDNWNEYFDVILANPPFFSPKGGITPHNRFGIKSSKAEVLFVDYINEHLKPNGRAGIIVPEGIIFQAGIAYKQLRKKLLETSLIGVVSLPAGVFQPYSGVKTSILILDKEKNKKDDKIFFGIVNNDGFSLNTNRTPIKDNDLSDLVNSIQNNKNDSKIIRINKNKILNKDDYSLSLSVYEEQKITTDFPYAKIGEVAEFINGAPFKPTDWGDEGIPIIRIQNLTRSNSKFNKTKKIVDKKYIVRNGDLLISWSATIGVFIWNGEDAYLNQHIFLVKNNDKILKKYLYFLKDKIIESIKSKVHGNTMTHITKGEFLDIKIPLPSIETQNQIVEELDGYQKIIDGCRQVIENYNPSIYIDPNWEKIPLGNLPIINLDSKRKPISKNDRVKGDVPYYGSTQIVDYVKDFIFNERLLLIGEDGAKWDAGEKTSFIIEGKSWVNNHVHVLKIDTSKISDVYLSTIINMLDLNSYISGAVVPKLTQQSLNKILIPIPDLELQKKLEKQILEEQKIIDGNKNIIENFNKKINKKISDIWKN